MNPEEIAQKYIKAETEAFQQGNFDLLAEIEDPNVVYHTPPQLQVQEMVGHEAHKKNILTARQAWSDIKQEWNYLTGEGNLFVLAYKARYISSGNVPGFPEAGKEITEDAMFILRSKNDRIVEGWAHINMTVLD